MVKSFGPSGRACAMIRCGNELALARGHYAMKKTQIVTVIVGTPIHRAGAYILDKFLANQKEIQQDYPSSELVLATVEDDFAEELEKLLPLYGIRGSVLRYETAKPDYARSRIWNIVCGREAIREYTLLQTEARYLLFLDADLTFDPNIIEVLEREIQGYDLVHSGYALRDFGICVIGLGCSMLTKTILEKVGFRCIEFRSGETIDEGSILELDLVRLRSRINKGIFLSACHHRGGNEARCIEPRPLGLFRRITTSPFLRYAVIRASIIVKRNILNRLRRLLNNFVVRLRRFSGRCVKRSDR
ncbi:glycosyltransferase family A protein [Chloroflexota bacterium]